MSRTAFTSVFVLAALAVNLLPMHSAAQIQNPIQAAKDAYNKAKQQQQQQQQAKPQQQQQQQSQQTKPQQQQGQPQSAAAPWTPPADDAGSGAAVTLDPAKMPDVLGVRLGMPAQEALAVLHKTFPSDIYQGIPVDWWPSTEKPYYGYNLLSRAPGNFTDVTVSFTAPPGPQVIWGLFRITQHLHTNQSTMVSALREKYGKETIAYGHGGGPEPPANDAAIGRLLWLYDETGARVPLPPNTVFPRGAGIMECEQSSKLGSSPSMPKDDDWGKNYGEWCGHHYVVLRITLNGTDIIESTVTSMEDVPLGIRTSQAAAAWLRDVAQKQHKDDLEKSKANKPTL